MIDITDAVELPNKYGGSELKKTIVLNNRIYMVKFPDPIRSKKIMLSYMNNQFSEDVGCKILKSMGLNVQNTFLAKYREDSGKTKIVVACEDFCQDGASTLTEFKKLALSLTDRVDKITNSVELVDEVIKKTKVINDKDDFERNFWDMFVGDALIGNSDRHLDNFGVIETNGQMSFAPIYDCGSSLSALVPDEAMEENLSNESIFKRQFSTTEYNVNSSFYLQGKRIFYHEIFKNPPAPLKDAICRVVPKIDTKKIVAIIRDTEEMSLARKRYLADSILMRYSRIHKRAYDKLFPQR